MAILIFHWCFKKMNSRVCRTVKPSVEGSDRRARVKLNPICIFWNFFLKVRIPKAKKTCKLGFFNLIALKSYRTFSRLKEKHAE